MLLSNRIQIGYEGRCGKVNCRCKKERFVAWGKLQSTFYGKKIIEVAIL